MGATDHGGLRRDRCRFFGCDGGEAVSQVLAVVHPNAGDGHHRTAGVGRGGIKPSPKPHFQHQQVAGVPVELQQGGGHQQFKRGEPMPFVQGLERLQPAAQGFNRNGGPLDPDAFTPAHQVRGGGDPAAEAGGTEG